MNEEQQASGEKPEGADNSDSAAEMPFLDHLAELRARLIKSFLAILLFAILCFSWASELFALLSLPIHKGAGDEFRLIGTGPAEAFLVKLKVALGAGTVLAAPVLFFQLWAFIAPGLLAHEKRHALPFVAGSTAFFLIGISFCYWLVLPFAFDFFVAEFSSIGVAPEIRIGEYLSFTIRLLLVFGLIFELPILCLFAALLGLVSSEWLKSKGRYAIVVIFVLAAILTPPDVVTQCLLAVPLIGLYLLCILITKQIETRRHRQGLATGSQET